VGDAGPATAPLPGEPGPNRNAYSPQRRTGAETSVENTKKRLDGKGRIRAFQWRAESAERTPSSGAATVRQRFSRTLRASQGSLSENVATGRGLRAAQRAPRRAWSGRQRFGWDLRRRRSIAYHLGHIERPLVSILNLCIQWAGDERYPDIHRRLSVRTERLPAGLLHVGEPPLSFQGLTRSQYHLTGHSG
jgi:hypothetical protein